MTEDTKPLKWVANTCATAIRYAQAIHLFEIEREALKAWESYLAWVEKYTRGPPKATELYSEVQLIQRGVIGLYEDENPELIDDELAERQARIRTDP